MSDRVNELKGQFPSIKGLNLTDALIGAAASVGIPVSQNDKVITLGRFRLQANGIDIPEDITQQEWSQLGFVFYMVKNSLQWWIGDWINGFDAKWGDTYTAAQQITRLKYGTLRNIASVAGSIELSRRRDNLSFAHHAEVASIEDVEKQDAWLKWASEGQVSRSALRLALRGELPTPERAKLQRKAASRVRSAMKSVLSQYNAGSAPSPDVIANLRAVLDAMEQEQPPETIIRILKVGIATPQSAQHD